jgi:hypothetical protein
LEQKTDRFERTDAGRYYFDSHRNINDKNLPATIEIYALGAGGGGQGGHWSGAFKGTGGAGGGGAAAYVKVTVPGNTTFDISVGEGGKPGIYYDHGSVNFNPWQSGSPGWDGEWTTVVWGANVLYANGGKGGGGDGQNLNGGSPGYETIIWWVSERLDWLSYSGVDNATSGTRDGDIQSTGGTGASIRRGSVTFEGGKGSNRPAGQRPSTPQAGGGGAGETCKDGTLRNGSQGGDGRVIIVVTYYE